MTNIIGLAVYFGTPGVVWEYSQGSHELCIFRISGGIGADYITDIPLWYWSEYNQ